MSGGFTTVGHVLKLLDMTPHRKGKRTFIEKLPSTQNLDGGNLSGLMGKLQGGGLTELFKNPMAAIAGPLQQLISAVTRSAGGGGGTPDVNVLTEALSGPGGLAAALADVTHAADRLSGVLAPDAGQFGITALALHEGVLDTLGPSAPPELSLATAAGPKTCVPLLVTIADDLREVNKQVILRQMSYERATTIVSAHTTKLNAIITASNYALATGEAMAQNVAQVHTVAALLAVGSDELKALLRDCLQPDALTAMNDAMTDRLTIRPPDGTTTSPAPESKTVCA